MTLINTYVIIIRNKYIKENKLYLPETINYTEAKENITTPDFVYYLVCSSIVKESAIKSMVGSSGRQRVQTDVIKKLNIALPPYNEQKKIGQILKGLDDKIKLNNEINSNLAA